MAQHLLFAVRLYADGMGIARYHGMSQGAPEWPPAPARVFQALVAGVARGQALPEEAVPALAWLEQLPPPLIAAPHRTLGQNVSLFVPNNDADALPDPSDVSGIRTAKQVQPSLFDGAQPLLYAWPMPDDAAHAPALIDAAHRLYQLGRGLDMAWADAQVLADDSLQRVLDGHGGVIHQPAPGSAGRALACPAPGTLRSLMQRHRATRLHVEGVGRKSRVLFTNPPKPRFATVSYAPSRRTALYDLRERSSGKPWPWSLHRASALVERVRDAAAARLQGALGDPAGDIERCLVGKAAAGSGATAVAQRVRILPLPSIGSEHADQLIRRILVEIPTGCPLAADDVNWAFSGLDWADPETGEISPWVLTKADNLDMQAHYAGGSRYWQSVTAVALPESAQRRRIDPTRQREEAKDAAERQAEEAQAIGAVRIALRHAGLAGLAAQVRVQREPFVRQGKRAETFAVGTRFAKARLWHVAIGFDRAVTGPLAIGDGRFLGLGVLAPVRTARGDGADPGAPIGVQTDGAFALRALPQETVVPDEPLALARALRRAVMARVRDTLGLASEGGLAAYFSGHADEPEPPDAKPSRHLAFHWDAPRHRWLVLAPHRLERRPATRWERTQLATLDEALDGLNVLLAGRAGRFGVQRIAPLADDPLLKTSQAWESVTPYVVTRHRRLSSAAEALAADARSECARHGLPEPEVQVLGVSSAPGRGLQGRLRLRFSVAVDGPLALGRTGLLGGGLFAALT